MSDEAIGLFGGSFNPPHVCHVLASVWALQTQPLDQLWWVPAWEHAFGKSLEPYHHRRRMCDLAVDGLEAIALCDIERDLELSHTIDTVRALEERHPDRSFALVVGSDILEERDEWKQWDRLTDRVELIVVGRSGFGPDAQPQTVPFELPDVSSTRLRDALGEDPDPWVASWLTAEVFDYIREHELYGVGD
ncbi:MAG: nicotinate (nicotinamide) nucleotide adenylyltransferase [Bradymonadaceae bacterium]